MLRTVSCLAFVFLIAGSPALHGADGCRDDGIVWVATGTWALDKTPVGRFDRLKPVDYRSLTADSAGGRLLILHKGEWYIDECKAGSGGKKDRCASRCESAPKSASQKAVSPTLWARMVQAINGRPENREPMSRSSGWTDSIVALEPSGNTARADLADVFRGGRQRAIAIRICPTDRNLPCPSRPYAVDWNGTTAILASADLTSGTFRVVEGEDESDAWVRFVPAGDRDRLRTAYAAAVREVESWELPADAGPAPALQRLHRVILTTVN